MVPKEIVKMPQAMKTVQAKKTIIFVAVLLLVAIVSATALTRVFSSSESYLGQYKILDEKRENVSRLTALSAGIAAAITLLPDDTCTPLAEELTEVSKGFGVVIGALLLEKYLLTTIGSAFFMIVVPCCCLLLIVAKLMSPANMYRQVLQQAALKFFIFGVVLFLTIPASVYVSSKIDDTYAETVDATIADAEETTSAVEESESKAEDEKSEGLLDVIGNQLNNLGDGVKSAVTAVSGAVGWAQNQVSNFVELLAVMVVTSVVIPLVIPVVIYLAFKTLLGQQQVVMAQPMPMEMPALVKGSRRDDKVADGERQQLVESQGDDGQE